MKALIGTSVSNAKKVLTRALPYEIRDIDNDINNASINKVTATKRPKRKIAVWLVLVANGRLIAYRGFWTACIDPILDGWV